MAQLLVSLYLPPFSLLLFFNFKAATTIFSCSKADHPDFLRKGNTTNQKIKKKERWEKCWLFLKLPPCGYFHFPPDDFAHEHEGSCCSWSSSIWISSSCQSRKIWQEDPFDDDDWTKKDHLNVARTIFQVLTLNILSRIHTHFVCWPQKIVVLYDLDIFEDRKSHPADLLDRHYHDKTVQGSIQMTGRRHFLFFGKSLTVKIAAFLKLQIHQGLIQNLAKIYKNVLSSVPVTTNRKLWISRPSFR